MQYCRIYYNATGEIQHFEAQDTPFTRPPIEEAAPVVTEICECCIANIDLSHEDIINDLKGRGRSNNIAEEIVDEAKKLSAVKTGEVELVANPLLLVRSVDGIAATFRQRRKARDLMEDLRKSPTTGEPEWRPQTLARKKTAITNVNRIR